VYYVWDSLAYRKEALVDVIRDKTSVQPLRLLGKRNLLYLLGVVMAALFILDRPLPGLPVPAAPRYAREAAMLVLAGLSLLTTPRGIRTANRFNFSAIGEVAALFLGLFITMQVPIEILRSSGASLGAAKPWHFFWASGVMSSFLDNAPTYAVFFEAACSVTGGPAGGALSVLHGQFIRVDLLAAISLGAVFMGANTYIGNGPNFMARAIAEDHGIKMPSFFAYMLYSGAILIPLFILVTFVFFR
jgi:Na+/H+ antiporter NhaD/arsenite permease-like protein